MRCLVSTTIPQPPNPDVLDVRPGDEDAATQVRPGSGSTPPAAIPCSESGSSWPTWVWLIGWPAATATAAGPPPRTWSRRARAGLIAAIDRNDPDHGSPFVAYAVACVVGELKRHLRDTSWRLHVPRPHKERALRLCQAADELHQHLGRPTTTTELAECLDVGEAEILEELAAVASRQELSLDQPIGVGENASGCLGNLVAAPGAREEPEDLLALTGMLAALPKLEREVIVLRFFQDLDQDEIAARVGFFQMHVSRLQRRALARLRAQLVDS
jgi:RNA polymerase sigma-B factor